MEKEDRLLVGCRKLGKEIADALGLKNARSIDIHIDCNSIATVKAECYIEVDGARRFPALLKNYELTEKESENEYGDVTRLGDDIKSYDHKAFVARAKDEHIYKDGSGDEVK